MLTTKIILFSILKELYRRKKHLEVSISCHISSKMFSTFYKNYLKKSTIMSLPIDFTPPMAKLPSKPMAKLLNVAKRKYGRLAKVSIK